MGSTTLIHTLYALAADKRLSRSGRLARFITYYAARGGTNGKIFVGSTAIAKHLGIDIGKVCELRARALDLGYIVPDGKWRNVQRYQLTIPNDPAYIGARVLEAMSPRSADRPEILDAIRELCTPNRTIQEAQDLFNRAVALIGHDRLMRRYAEILARNERPHQEWRCWVADNVLSAQNCGRLDNPSDGGAGSPVQRGFNTPSDGGLIKTNEKEIGSSPSQDLEPVNSEIHKGRNDAKTRSADTYRNAKNGSNGLELHAPPALDSELAANDERCCTKHTTCGISGAPAQGADEKGCLSNDALPNAESSDG